MIVTSAEINALPANIRRFIMELEAMADPSGMIRRNMQLEHDNQALQAMIVELKKASN